MRVFFPKRGRETVAPFFRTLLSNAYSHPSTILAVPSACPVPYFSSRETKSHSTPLRRNGHTWWFPTTFDYPPDLQLSPASGKHTRPATAAQAARISHFPIPCSSCKPIARLGGDVGRSPGGIQRRAERRRNGLCTRRTGAITTAVCRAAVTAVLSGQRLQ